MAAPSRIPPTSLPIHPVLAHYLDAQKAAFPLRAEGYDNTRVVEGNLTINSRTDFTFAMGYLASLGTTDLTATTKMLCGRAALIGGKEVNLNAIEVELAGDADAPVQVVALESIKINATVLKFRNVYFYLFPNASIEMSGRVEEVTNVRIIKASCVSVPITKSLEFYHFTDRGHGVTELEIIPTVVVKPDIKETLLSLVNSPFELGKLFGISPSITDAPAKKPGSRDEGSPGAPPAPVSLGSTPSSAPADPVAAAAAARSAIAPPPGPADQQ